MDQRRFAELKEGRLPMGKPQDEWSYGDMDAGLRMPRWSWMKRLPRPTPAIRRSSLAPHWLTGRTAKCSFTWGHRARCRPWPGSARWLNMDPNQIVLISEYTGGGFGSKATGYIFAIIPALLSKKANAPVMMRISREEEHFIGRARPGFQGRMKVGFAKDGRITAAGHVCHLQQRPLRRRGRRGASGVSFLCCISRRRCAGAG